VNKSGLIDAISNTTTLTKREADAAVDAFLHAVTAELRAGRRVSLVGFGSFNPTQRGPRMGRNPQTGEPVKIPAATVVRFSAGTTLKAVVNGTTPLPPLASSTRRASAVRKPSAQKVLKKPGTTSTTKAVRRASGRKVARRPVGKVARRAPTTGAPARRPATRSANKAVRRVSATRPAQRAPARKAAKRSAAKAVRRA